MALNRQGNDVEKQYHNVIFVWVAEKNIGLKKLGQKFLSCQKISLEKIGSLKIFCSILSHF